ncbi:MAG: lipase class 2 [Marmoricola sp.]|nr:lipase class 2 [Marmoricola sp.]
MLASLSPPRRRFVLVTGTLALAVVVGIAALAWVRQGPAAATPVTQNAQPPVLLVPGYGGSTSGLEVLASALRASGRDAVVVTLGGGGTGDLHRQADRLDTDVHRVLRRTGSGSVDLVGYSAGGVVVRLWVAEHHGGGIARRIVTLGSPQHGTAVAGLASDIAPTACPTACRQLAPDSALIRSLNAGDETPAGPVWVSIWTDQDKTVVPPDSASLAGAEDFSVQSVCPGTEVSHGQLPANSTVIAMTVRALRRALPTVPTGSVCR